MPVSEPFHVADDAMLRDAAPQTVRHRKTCPLCNGEGRIAFAKYGIPIVDCAACSHRFADYSESAEHIECVYADSYFDGEGEYAAYELEADVLRARGAWYGRLLRHMLPGGSRVLDVGSASGHILEGLQDAGWTGIDVDPNPTMAARARSRGIDVRASTIEAFALEEPVDAVTFVQVLPHVFDLRAAIRQAREATAESGILLVECWNRESLVARALGRRWHAYNPPSVLHWLSRASHRALLARAWVRVSAIRQAAQARFRSAREIGLQARSADALRARRRRRLRPLSRQLAFPVPRG